MDYRAVKKTKLANLLLNSQDNMEADIEAILYRSPFAGRTIVRWESSQPSPAPKTILVAPLTPKRGLTPPPNLYPSPYSVRLVSNFDIPSLNKKSTVRRAEYSYPTDATRHSLDVRCNLSHQQALYEFALVTCLGVSSATSSLLLDVGCGAHFPFGGHSLTKDVPFKLGLDQSVRPIPGIDFAQCSLVGSRLPLRDSSVNYIVTISFAQWVTADEDLEVTSLFARECVRVLADGGGAGVLQFYPGNKRDLDAICEALADAHHCVRGCRLSARPVKNRGIKIFVYFVKY
ncbi:unnamed protein product [Hydatigera taeniaeformis]|uniref:Methyltransferase type 11 domain-containing protein n=1 Tax=Hydatigena taeniaeformis TaxID=6205 RepID=A0A3P7G357_HYDTA|nr:unnamed protein product [Hydatigera taeniaeformis]